jgi:hypothetical protein
VLKKIPITKNQNKFFKNKEKFYQSKSIFLHQLFFEMDRILKFTSRMSTVVAVAGSIGALSLYTVDGGECAVLWVTQK